MPHKLAERQYPGTVDEKVNCEVATYAWMQEHCAEVRIPGLWAFGFFAESAQFTHVSLRPLHVQFYHRFRQCIHRLFRYPLLSNYIRDSSAPNIDSAYVLLEHIGPETGEMLSSTWAQHCHDDRRRARLYKGMSHVKLSLARLPQPHIGSFRFNVSNGTVTLSNRPLTCTTMIFENSGTPRNIQSGQVYRSSENFVSGTLTLHDNHLLHDSHAVRNDNDARERMSIRTLLRAVSHLFILPQQRDGPFLLQLTDSHQSNIFVDQDWNVTCLIDLEWISALPAELLAVPHWLTSCSTDTITDQEYHIFDEERQAFLTAMDEQARGLRMEHDIQIPSMVTDNWDSKRVWFWACLRSIIAWLFVFEDHFMPLFSTNANFVNDLKQVSTFWHQGIESVIEHKVTAEQQYQSELQSLLDARGD